MKVRMKNPFSLKGETALITGGGTGLGFGIASSFVRAGARVVLVGRRAGVLEKAANLTPCFRLTWSPPSA